MRTTQDPLREHGGGTPPNITTAYQLVLMMSGHTERHTAQLLEVKASAGISKVIPNCHWALGVPSS